MTADSHNWIHASGTDYQYDAAGNMTFDATAGLSYTFDQENRLTGASGYAYTYDSDGNRVRKSNGNLAANGTLYWYMTPGVVAETDLAGTLKSEYVFFDGERVARRDGATGTGGVFYYFSDHLKTASVITDSAGVIKAESDYYPWGGEIQFVNNDSNDYKFTGKKRDIETSLDYFGARYYSNGLGRWVSADWSPTPIPVPYADFHDPQSLNLYSYVRGVPTTRIDVDGHAWGGDNHNIGYKGLPDGIRKQVDAMARKSAEAWLKAKKTLDIFNGTLGFEKTNCAGGKDCLKALEMAGTALVAAILSDGGSEEAVIERQIAQSEAKIERLIARVIPEDLEAAQREINGGMKVAKAAEQGLYDHVDELRQYRNGLERQAKHLERILKRDGLKESQVNRMNTIIERARGMSDTILNAITPRETM